MSLLLTLLVILLSDTLLKRNMKNIFFKKIVSTSIFIMAFVLLSPINVNADLLNDDKKEEFQDNVNSIAINTGYSTNESLEDIIGNAIRVVLSVLGVVFLLLMVLAGQNWMRAGGNEEKVQKAKKQIKSLVIGLIIILAAYAISFWVSGILANVLAN